MQNASSTKLLKSESRELVQDSGNSVIFFDKFCLWTIVGLRTPESMPKCDFYIRFENLKDDFKKASGLDLFNYKNLYIFANISFVH